MADHAGRFDFGGGIDDASDGALRREFAPLPSAGIDALQRRTLKAAAVPVEIPIGNTIDRGDDARSRSEQGLHHLDRAGDGMRFQANDHKILRPKLGGIVGAARPHHVLVAADQQGESVLAHGGKMRAARDEADVGARARELHAEISADRAGAVDTDFHAVLRTGWCEFRRRTPRRLEWQLKAGAIMAEGRFVRQRKRIARP